jgi:asparagine synthase (glutamine-hydrolysing)
MCGIIGEINISSCVDLEQFNQLRDRMFHRGPDGFGTELLLNGSIAFGHRRLSIIDLTDNAKQPMCNEDGSIWITFNGEIYNHQLLRKELEVNHYFKSNSDTEVLIHGYEEWGLTKLLEKTKGMFAFGLFDENKNKLYIARDRFGIKPLVYSYNNDKFLFASELKSIANHKEFGRILDWNSIADYFTYSYVPYPNTVWTNAKKLPPAHYGILNLEDFSFEVNEYWTLRTGNKIISDIEAIKESDRLVRQAIEEHLISDVPIGLFLSGGYDSSILLSNMLSIGYKPDVFTVAFPGHVNNEIEQAKLVSKVLGVKQHIEEIPSNADILALLEELAPFYDEPFAGSSMINNHLIAKLTSESFKVAFSGEGADEVFGGYKWYPKIENHYEQLKIKRILKSIRDGEIFQNNEFLELYNRSMLGIGKEGFKFNVLTEKVKGTMKNRAFWHFENNMLTMKDKVKQAQFLDFKTFIPNHCLPRADISSMANSLEVRVPFLDHEIYEFVFSLDRSVYMKKGVKKFLLESQLKNKIPHEVLKMPKKGFSFHFSGNNFNDRFYSIMKNSELRKHGILRETENLDSISDHFKFHLLNLELWFKNHGG